jgi:methylglutaconyl-CoA hydratase
MAVPAILCDTDRRGVATVTLNRPEVHNAYDAALVEALHEAFRRLAADDAVRVVVVRGAGRHFQAGADLRWLEAVRRGDEAANREVSRRTAAAMRGLAEMAKPTLALVHGACIGGGTGLVASCDIAIAERTASFAISEVHRGMTAAIIFPQLLGAIGLRNLRRYALSGERFDAARALAIGLVHEVCEPGALDAAAAPVIEALLEAAPGALAQSKRSMLRTAGAFVAEPEFERLVREHAAQRTSAEAAEGLRSFAEKRKPGWVPR